MTAAHIPSDDTAIRAADDNRTVQAHRALDEAVAWLKRKPSWAALECVQDRALAVFLDRVRVLEANACSSAQKPSIGAGSVLEADDEAPYLSAADIENYRQAANAAKANPARITPAPNGERKPVPVVPKYPSGTDYR